MVFSSINAVRLRHGFHSETVVEGAEILSPFTSFNLDRRAYNIIEVLKNGVTLSDPADFTFTPPTIITLTIAAVSTDVYSINQATELEDSVITQYLTQATATIQGALEHRFGLTTVDEWDSPGPAPDLITELATEMAGLGSVRSMVRKSHKFDPNVVNALNSDEKRVMMLLKKIRDGDIRLPGTPAIAGDGEIGRGFPDFTVGMDDIRDVDLRILDKEFGTDGSALQTLRRERR